MRAIYYAEYVPTELGNPRWIAPDLARGTTPTVRNPGIDFLNFRHPVARAADFGGRAAWTGDRYKLVVLPGTGDGIRTELYDLLEDPGETTNIADRFPDVVARMTAELHGWQRSVEQSLTGADYK